MDLVREVVVTVAQIEYYKKLLNPTIGIDIESNKLRLIIQMSGNVSAVDDYSVMLLTEDYAAKRFHCVTREVNQETIVSVTIVDIRVATLITIHTALTMNPDYLRNYSTVINFYDVQPFQLRLKDDDVVIEANGIMICLRKSLFVQYLDRLVSMVAAY